MNLSVCELEHSFVFSAMFTGTGTVLAQVAVLMECEGLVTKYPLTLTVITKGSLFFCTVQWLVFSPETTAKLEQVLNLPRQQQIETSNGIDAIPLYNDFIRKSAVSSLAAEWAELSPHKWPLSLWKEILMTSRISHGQFGIFLRFLKFLNYF